MTTTDIKTSAFCAAIDEGDASPDVMNFNPEGFIKEMKNNWQREE